MSPPTADSPFLIGIDLGTTNSACAFVDTRQAQRAGRAVPDSTADRSVRRRAAGRCCRRSCTSATRTRSTAARSRCPGTRSPTRSSACSRASAVRLRRRVRSRRRSPGSPIPGVDRQAAILPWSGADAGPRISPVDASARCLAHIRDAWNATVAAGDDSLRLERQRIVLTVPASFDEEARELTVDAARKAQLSQTDPARRADCRVLRVDGRASRRRRGRACSSTSRSRSSATSAAARPTSA